ncbi:exonuclease SbcCD subunit D, partial [[Kitasatospora] papulosa]
IKMIYSHQRQTYNKTYRTRVNARSDHEITLGFLDHVTGVPATVPEQNLLQEGLESVRTAAAAREAS